MIKTILDRFLNFCKNFCDVRFRIIQKTMIDFLTNNACATLQYAIKSKLGKVANLKFHHFICIFFPLSVPLHPHLQILASLFHNANRILNQAIGY